MRYLGLLIIVLLIAGCVTERKAYKWLDRNPKSAARYASVKFPAKPEYIPGKPVILRDTQYVKGPAIPCPPDSTGHVHTVECPDYEIIYQDRHITDTLKIPDNAEAEFQRLRANELERELSSIRGQNDALLQRQNELKSDKRKTVWWAIGGWAAAALFVFLLVKRIF